MEPGRHEDLFLYSFFHDPATTEIYTLSLHDALPISAAPVRRSPCPNSRRHSTTQHHHHRRDRKSTRLNSSHANISYAVFSLTKKNHPKRHKLAGRKKPANERTNEDRRLCHSLERAALRVFRLSWFKAPIPCAMFAF